MMSTTTANRHVDAVETHFVPVSSQADRMCSDWEEWFDTAKGDEQSAICSK